MALPPPALGRRQTVTVTQTAGAPTTSSANDGQWSPSSTVWWPTTTATTTPAASASTSTPGGTIINTTATDAGGFTIVIELSVPNNAPSNTSTLAANSTLSSSTISPSSNSSALSSSTTSSPLLPDGVSPLPAASAAKSVGLTNGQIVAVSLCSMAGLLAILALLFLFARRLARSRRENAYGSLSASGYPDFFAPRDFAGSSGKFPRSWGTYRSVDDRDADGGDEAPEMSVAAESRAPGTPTPSVRWADWGRVAQRPHSMDLFRGEPDARY